MNNDQRPTPEEIVVVHRTEGASSSESNLFDRTIRTASLVAIPIVMAILGWVIQDTVAKRSLSREYVQLAISILTQEETAVQPQIRNWAVDLLAENSPTKFKPEMLNQLKSGTLKLPQFSEAELMDAVEPLVGSRAIARELVKWIFTPGLYYSDYQSHVTFSYLPKYEEWSELQRNEFMQAKVSTKLNITNMSDDVKIYPLRASFFDIANPEEGKFTFESVLLVPLNPDGEELKNEKIVWSRESLIAQTMRTSTLSKDIEIEPHQSFVLEIKVIGYERQEFGQYFLQSRLCAENMKLVVSFPDETFEKYAIFSHPNAADPNICPVRMDDNTAEASIVGGLLPYQGITVTWSKRVNN